jgi:uncharacterized membrane-anchored protein
VNIEQEVAVILGRRGYIYLTGLGTISEFQKNKKHFQEITSNIKFNGKEKYEDYKKGVDKESKHDFKSLIKWLETT